MHLNHQRYNVSAPLKHKRSYYRATRPLLRRPQRAAFNVPVYVKFLPLCILRTIRRAVLSIAFPSVRLSVCLSVKRVNCDKTKQTSAEILIPYKRSIHLVFRQEERLVGDDPLYL